MDNIYVKSFLDTLHLIATITWFGTLFANFALILPVVKNSLDSKSASAFMGLFMKKARMVVYVSLAVLFITGIPLKIVNENYVSIINFSNNWQIAMFCKHALVALLALLSIINFEFIGPKIKKSASTASAPQLERMKHMQLRIGMTSVLIAFIIIVISAIMNHL